MVMETTPLALLTNRLFDIMAHLEQKPAIYLKVPAVSKFQVVILDKVLEGIYRDLPYLQNPKK